MNNRIDTMKKHFTDYFERSGAIYDPVKKRAEFITDSFHEKNNKIIGYFLSESMYVFIYSIDHDSIPDHGLELRSEGRYLRVNCCRKGGCRFTKKNQEMNLYAGETAMDYNDGNDGSFMFTADEYLGVEVIMQVDKVIREHTIMAALKKAVKRMALPDYAMQINSLYFVSESEHTSRILDDIIKYAFDNADSEVILVKVAELAYTVGKDLEREKKSKTHYVSGSQKKIAQEVHDRLTYDFGKKWTVRVFADHYGLSETTIKNYFRNVYGCGFREYQLRIRMENAAKLLTASSSNIGEISSLCGYYSQAKFGAAFKKYYHTTPLEYRRLARIKANSSRLE